jgi:hypothetical protein
VSSVTKNTNGILSETKYQLSVIRHADNQILQQENQLHNLANLTLGLYDSFRVMEDSQINGRGPIAIDAYHSLLTTIHAISEYVQDVHDMVQQIRVHRLPRQLIEQSTLTATLSNISNLLPNGMEMILDPTTQAPYYYEEPLTIHVPATNRIRCALKVPIADAEQKFTLYEAIPYPHTVIKQAINATADTSTETMRLQWEGPPQTVAISADKERYIDFLSTFDRRSCIPTRPLICPDRHVVTTSVTGHCLFQLLTGRTDEEPDQKCRYRPYTSTKTVAIPLDAHKWAISTTRQERVKTKCMVTGTKDLLKRAQVDVLAPKGESILTVPNTCQAVTDNLWLPYRLHLQGPQLHHQGHQLPPINVNLPEWNRITATAMDLPNTLARGHAELVNMLSDMNRTGIRFADYANNVKNRIDIQPITPGHTESINTHHYLSYSALLVTLTLLTGLMCMECRRQGFCCTCCRQPTGSTQPDSRGRESIVVNFAPKTERVRFIEPTEQKILNQGKPKTRRANRPTQTEYEE